jgi:hypothetical protein
VHDEVFVGVLHAGADLAKQIEPLVNRQPVIVAVPIDRLAIHELHHEVRLAVGRRAAVHQPRDVGVIERRQRLALQPETLHDLRRVGPRTHDLQRGMAAEGGVGALGAVHHAHAAAAHHIEHAPRTDRRADQPHGRGPLGRHVRQAASRRFEETRRPFVPGEQRAHFLEECRVARTGLIDERRAVAIGHVQRGLEDPLRVGPGRGAAHR